MNRWIPTEETVLEAGIAALLGAVVAAVGLLVGGPLVGEVKQQRRQRQRPPSPGIVPPIRHAGSATSPIR